MKAFLHSLKDYFFPDGDGCACECEENEECVHGFSAIEYVIIGASALMLVCSFIKPIPEAVRNALLVVAILLTGFPVLVNGIRNLFHLHADENLLMSISVVTASAIGELREAAAVAVLFGIGEAVEKLAEKRSRRSIEVLSEIRPDSANLLLADGTSEKCRAEDIEVGNEILILPFERIPLDCVVTQGEGSVDACAITGESIPVEVAPGSELLSGMINAGTVLRGKVINTFGDSAASRIIKMVSEAAERKGNAQRIITRFSKYYTPAVVLFALCLAVIPVLFGYEPREWIYRGLIVLVASCPCALVLSVPLGFFAGIGAASRKGILIKGGIYLEMLEKARAVAFDKTGTLTTSRFTVVNITPADGFSEDDVLKNAAAAEIFSEHPIAKSIIFAYSSKQGFPDIDELEKSCSSFEEIPGKGSLVVFGGLKVLCGSKRLMDAYSIDVSFLPDASVYVALNGNAAGCIEVESEMREDAASTVHSLRRLGVKRVAILTGDGDTPAQRAAELCGADSVHARLLPGQKLDELEKIKDSCGTTVFVGDGINDAPVLAAANVGAAMGLGTSAAIQSGDIVLSGSKLSSLIEAIRISKRTMRVVRENIVFATGVKLAVLCLGAFGLAPIWLAVFADAGVCVLAVLNSARIK